MRTPGTIEVSEVDYRQLVADRRTLIEALCSAKIALIECGNVIRPTLPSLANNVIGAHLKQIDAALKLAGED